MKSTSFPHLLIIAPPGRLRENLSAMAVSVMTPEAVRIADNWQSAEDRFKNSLLDLILIDFREPDEKMKGEIEKIHQRYPGALIVFLQYCLGQNLVFSGPAFREVVYGDVSGEVLLQLASEVKRTRNQ